jgi:cytochrome c-type biogenesis protein
VSQGELTGLFAFLAGLFSFFTPCILPIVPSFLIFVGGISSDKLLEPNGPSHSLLFISHVLAFILGFSILLIFLGCSASFVGRWVISYQVYLLRASGVILLLFGLFYIFPSLLPFLGRERILTIKRRPESLLGSFLIGLSFFLGWTPCLSPSLSSILLVSSSGPPARGLLLSTLYALGLAIPFLLSAVFLRTLLHRTRRLSLLSLWVQRLLGFLLILMGLFLMVKGTVPAIPL